MAGRENRILRGRGRAESTSVGDHEDEYRGLILTPMNIVYR